MPNYVLIQAAAKNTNLHESSLILITQTVKTNGQDAENAKKNREFKGKKFSISPGVEIAGFSRLER